MAGKPPPITSPSNSDFPGQMIGVTILFTKRPNTISDTYHKKGRGRIKIYLSSIYYSVEHEEKKRFNEEPASFYNAIPRKSELLSDQNINTNFDVRSNMLSDVLGQQGIDNCNAKVRDLQFLLKNNKF